MTDQSAIERAKAHFGEILEQQISRIEAVKNEGDFIDYRSLDRIVIGIIGGDGIGPAITEVGHRVLRSLLKDEVDSGRVVFKIIEGLTIENRAKHMQAIPDEVLAEIKQCHVTLKGPTTTPEKGDGWPNIESANVGMRKALDLFANVRPVRVPSENIDWMFYRENTEDLYALGSQGIDVTDDFSIDFRLISTPGSERIIRAAFEYAKSAGKTRVTVVTKANIVKSGDGRFLQVAERVAKDYPDIEWDSWYIDIMTAKLLDKARRSDFQVMVMPNLYGDILTDEAAEIQGGVGTAGSANIGKKYSMFEAIHGSAPRMVKEGRAQYADPSSVLKAAGLMLTHIGFPDLGNRVDMALEVCGQYERKIKITGRDTGCTGQEYGQYVLDTVADPDLDSKWKSYAGA
ncbi:MAG: isocitrate/isopropylmalate dehydrogenase family protein [Chloroflexi bacterium]|nr:isocitrate/isopropylmalate dehydrogenase family protein [Chloroflexota bacterium]MCH8115292.1 isocitrate/isopropylmalate dehydrogenase family protein [Chloroflexota bacterium]MCI0803892.1 isocitrate/isopropylmalate dehydrogenase family protein [Chloroflexota bacterium]MCI0808628.1 isocitrate/isopropylmalate dehydrogenase family protein [Chloroflexota bacterium]MCI0833759.1 isocitrate/isopropylmalate dehydrogenase family protein [Chloroflexota bacterium]